MEHPFESPAEPRVPGLVSPGLLLLLTFFCTPLGGAALAATNWFRVGHAVRGLAVLAAAGAATMLGLVATAIPEPAGNLLYLVIVLGSMAAIYRDQQALHGQHPSSTTVRSLPIGLAAAFLWMCAAASPTLLWIVSGNPSVRPDWIGPPPCPDAVASTAPEAGVFATWRKTTGPAGGFLVRMPEAIQELTDISANTLMIVSRDESVLSWADAWFDTFELVPAAKP